MYVANILQWSDTYSILRLPVTQCNVEACTCTQAGIALYEVI